MGANALLGATFSTTAAAHMHLQLAGTLQTPTEFNVPLESCPAAGPPLPASLNTIKHRDSIRTLLNHNINVRYSAWAWSGDQCVHALPLQYMHLPFVKHRKAFCTSDSLFYQDCLTQSSVPYSRLSFFEPVTFKVSETSPA